MNPLPEDVLEALEWRSKNAIRPEGLREDLGHAVRELRDAYDEIDRLQQHLRREETLHDDTLHARDHAEMWADRLAADLAKLKNVNIGEHSNGNDPWWNAWAGENHE